MQGREYQVARQRSLDGNLGGFLVANFADENDVGIVAQNRAQPARKGQASFFGDLDLVDAAQLIFDRILDSDDFSHRIVDLVEGGVKR